MLKQLMISLSIVLSLHGNETDAYFDNPHSETLKTVLTDINSEPSSIVAGCVNVITGDYVEFDVDLTIPAPEPFIIQRSHSSSDHSSGLLYRAWRSNLQSNMNFKFIKGFRHQTTSASYLGACGERMHFEGEGYLKDDSVTLKPLKKMYKNGLTNTSKGAISGKTHPKNTRVVYDNDKKEGCVMTLGSGEKHRFRRYGDDHKYLLREITKSSGISFHYTYIKDQVVSVELKNRAGREVARASILYDAFPKIEKKVHWVSIQAPDGRAVNYRFEDFSKKRDYYILTDVLRSDGPPVHYVLDEPHYKKGNGSDWSGSMELIKRKELPEGRFVEVDYYRKGDNLVLGKNFKIDDYTSKRCNRVKEIKLPVGVGGTAVSCYKFVYNLVIGPGQTKTTVVYDPYNRKTEYNFNQEDRLTQIVEHDKNEQPYSSERLFWGQLETSQQINLQWRVFGPFHSNIKSYARAYEYDGKGNICRDTLFGIITGTNLNPLVVNNDGAPIDCGVESKTRCYTYDELNNVKTMQEGDIIVEYNYIPGTSLVEASFYRDSSGIFRRNFFAYDLNAQVIEKITDDANGYDKNSFLGATERFITRTIRSDSYPYGLPIREVNSCVDVKTGEELPLTTLIQYFDSRARMVKQETFGADGAFAYSQEWDYDDYGNLTRFIDPLGRVVERKYDANGNCILEEGPIPGLKEEMEYDRMNRLIAIHEHHSDGITLTKRFQYDLKGNKICSIDAFGNSTHYQYDSFGRVIYQEGPGIENLEGGLTAHTVSFEYDHLSQITKSVDANGNATLKKCTILGKPYEITHPDGTMERMKYNLQGELIESLFPTGALTCYVRDGRGRVLRTEVYSSDGSLYASTECRYNQTKLLEEIDRLGNATHYEYDAYGRLKCVRNQEQCSEFEYDSLGRRVCTIQMNVEKSEGTVTRLKLDALGQILEERVEDISGELFTHSQFKYDELGRKIETKIGAALSLFKYDTHGMLVESIDPEGNITTCCADYFYFNAFGQRVLKTFTIDPKGIQTITCHDILGNKSRSEIVDPFGNLLHCEEMIYDVNGNLLQKTATPEPKRVYRFFYDAMNRLVETYQAFGTPDQKVHSYQYNAVGQKEFVIKPDGVVLCFKHDCFGRTCSITSSEGTISDQYIYDVGNNPIEIHNLITGKKTLRTFNSIGKLMQEINQNGLVTSFTYAYDGSIKTFTLPDSSRVEYAYKAGFLTEAVRKDTQGTAKYTHHISAYDSQGNILKEELPVNLGEITRSFSLNGNLLASSSPYCGETAASYDPLGNLLSRTISDPIGSYNENYEYDFLNQISKEQGHFNHTYAHDSHQNRLSKDDTQYTCNQLNQILSAGCSKLTYDLNGNLVTFEDMVCRYDALDRLIQVERKGGSATYAYDELNRCIQRNESRYFYVSQSEVGACNSNGKVTEFQMVGPGRSSAPCQALAIELNGIAYSTLHDQSGHLRVLVSHKDRKTSTYRYSAFGEKYTYQPTANPWTFAGKREDSLTSWILFGRRYYIPTLGRFLTQDPAGLSASPNLYAYLANSPLVRYDTYGLFESNPGFFSSLANTAWKIAHTASHIIATPAKAGNVVRKIAGSMIYHIGRNVVPVPVLQDIPQAVGYFLANSTLKDYVPSFKELDVDIVYGSGELNDKLRCGGVAGIGNTREDAVAFQKWAQEYNGYNTDIIYGPTHGFARDIAECLLEKLGVYTPLVEYTTNYTRQKLAEVGPEGVLKMDGHSRGGITISSVLPHLTNQERGRLWINTYGSGTIVSSRGQMHVMNHISAFEWVTGIGDPFCFAKAVFKQQDHVQFHHSGAFLVEHSIESPTYKEAFKKSSKYFYNEMRSRGVLR